MKIQTQLILWHRYLGIATCLLFVMWFASGIVMMYVQMPSLTPDERMAALPRLDASQLRIGPREAVERAEIGTPPQSITLTSLFGRPVYRVQTPGGMVTVFADDGQAATDFQWPEPLPSIFPYLPSASTHWHLTATLNQSDQWTLSGEMRALMPLYRIAVDDRPRTVLYVSAVTGDVVLKTTSRSRALAWAGAIPHWLYLTAIRSRAALWSRLVIGIAAVCCVTSIFGIVLGLSRYSPARRLRSPYQGGKLWHHWSGLVFGILTLTWAFSGFLSMLSAGTDPSREQIRAFTGGALNPGAFDLSRIPSGAKEVELSQALGKPLYAVSERPGKTVLLDASGNLAQPFSRDSLLKSAQEAIPSGRVTEARQLTDYDWYYYDRDWLLPLPVLRVKFDDPHATWLYIDPARGALVSRVERYNRVERWIYHGFHSWDFPFLWTHRPWWDVVVLVLLAGGLAVSLTGALTGSIRVKQILNN